MIKPQKAASVAFLEFMKTRHSVRHYDNRPVSQTIIENAIATAGRAPSGANQQPWHFVAIKDAEMKAHIRKAAEPEEEAFYAGGGGDGWIAALEPLGTTAHKLHFTDALWLFIVFAQRYGLRADNSCYKHYYVPNKCWYPGRDADNCPASSRPILSSAYPYRCGF